MILFIGHRGSGKSQFLKWCQKNNYFNKLHYFDLDQVIIESTGQTIDSIFQNQGEDYFRILEVKILQSLNQNYPDAVVAIGAGCHLDQLEFLANARIIWIRRTTDLRVRYFTNRPLLTQYQNRLPVREALYEKLCDEVLEIPEGLNLDNIAHIFQPEFKIPNTCITLSSWHLNKLSRLDWIFNQGSHQWVELRTDLLSLTEIKSYFQTSSLQAKKNILLSIRSPEAKKWINYLRELNLSFKIDIEEAYLSIYETLQLKDLIFCISSHKCDPPNLDSNHFPIKWSPSLTSWSNLMDALKWLKTPSTYPRYLMPRLHFEGIKPEDQNWIRHYLFYQQGFHFVRNCPQGSASNQPHWISFSLLDRNNINSWLAVLGYPIDHSISPTFHLDFSQFNQSHFLAIPITKELFDYAIKELCQLDFKGFAITSPLKTMVTQQDFIKKSYLVDQLNSANTLVKLANDWVAYNTDLIGVGYQLSQLLKLSFPTDIPTFIHKIGDLNTSTLSSYAFELKQQIASLSKEFLVFGGGGMLPILKWWLPDSSYIKARDSQEIRSEAKYFIWAATSEANLPKIIMPQLTNILDLNYAQTSPTVLLAQNNSVNYVSGELLFKAQAYCQQIIWKQGLVEDQNEK